MAIFAIRSSVKNVSNENSPDNPNNESTQTTPTPPSTSSGPRLGPEPIMQFDDDMAYFVSHLDADPLTETEVKMHLVEYDSSFGTDDSLIREISDDDDDYTYHPTPSPLAGLVPILYADG